MMSNTVGTLFNIQRFSTEDGPGIRTTVFLKGCPLRCLWCANPESQLPSPQVAHRDSPCIGCFSCIRACPAQAVYQDANGKLRIDRGKCQACGACVRACVAGAMQFYGRTATVGEVFADIKKDIGYYTRSGGGVTCSGGEPLMQADFVAELFGRCRALGIHTALETSGFCGQPELTRVLGLTDLFLFDIKLMDPAKHREYTGQDNAVILRNARLIAEAGVSMRIRIPVIPGVNDSEANLRDTALFVSGLPGTPPVELLPYHNLGTAKYEMLGMSYALGGLKRPDGEQMSRYGDIFRGFGLECTTG